MNVSRFQLSSDLSRHRVQFGSLGQVRIIWAEPESKRIPCKSRNDMQMNVKNLLTRRLAVGQKESDAFTLNLSRWHGQGNSLRDLKEMCTYVRRQIGKILKMYFRHYQDMARVDRLDIHEGQANI